MTNQKNIFCSAPFKTAVIDKDGVMMPCCDFMPGKPKDRDTLTKIDRIDQWWATDLNSLRDNMINNVPSEQCHHCYNKEENPTYNSVRKTTNSNYKFKIDSIINDYKNGQLSNIDEIEIRVSNYCNLRCIMCGGFASSSLASEYETYKEKFVSELDMLMPPEKTVRWWDDPANLNNLKNVLAHARTVKFAGGEPLIVPEVVDILNSLDPTTAKWIKFNTNLTRLTDKFLTALERFENVELTVSLEGYGAHNEYIRYDSVWSVIENNINRAKEHSNISIYINHVLQHTSLFSLPDLIAFADSKNIKINLHEIYYGTLPSPGVLTIHSAHAKDVEKFKYWLESYNGRYKHTLINWVNTYNYSQEFHDKFYKYINLLDSIRGCNFKETFNPTTE